jgi:hypothetical protein
MKRTLAILVLLLLATPVFATWWPVLSPKTVRIAVGEETSITATAWWSGLTDYGNGIHWAFHSADPQIATAYAEMHSSSSKDIPIVGIAPGRTFIYNIRNNSVDGSGLANIEVYCAPELPVIGARPVVDSVLGDAITLSVATAIAARTTFVWYAGELGDTSRPVPAGSFQLTFTPESAGTHHYWVLATTACSTSTAAFTVNVHRPRHRAVR